MPPEPVNVMLASLVHPWNALTDHALLAGTTSPVSLVHPENAFVSISVSLVMVNDARLVHPENALVPMNATPSGTEIVVIPELLKEWEPILVTVASDGVEVILD